MLEGLSVFFGGDSHRVARDVHDEPSQNDEHVVFITGASGGILTARLRFNSLVNVREFSLLPSAKQTRWLVPLGVGPCTSSGLDIYAPHKFVARGWKQLLAIAMRTGWTGWARRKLVIGSRRPLSLELLVNEVTGEANPVFALSLGTPNRFRKLTIQIMNRDGEVVGYAKLAITREAEARVRHEATTLQYLSQCSALRNQVPRLLYEGEWGAGYILIQSPAGQSHTAPGKFGAAHEQFLQRLWDIESVKKSGASLVEETGRCWKATERHLNAQWRDLGEAALRAASSDLGNLSIRCGISHGDFAPWNTRLLGGRLFTFDWESARSLSPNKWDVFHFQAQPPTC